MHLRLLSRRHFSVTAVLVSLLSLIGVTTTAQAAQQPSAQASAPRILTFANKCVDVQGAHTEDGALIRQWTCNGTVAQNFTIVPLGDGRVTIKTFANKCVDLQGAHSEDGTWLRQWTCNGTVAQAFTIVPLSNGHATIRTFVNKCFDVQGAHTEDGTWIRQWTCNSTVAQEFTV
ncbi:ricin-type beta-trefoil lectin protein [Actinocrispum wychmicini]|uniref:Ricin-type beta-trefoil lectin protein n=1 Tax=Actinocrispum wychmicini TaxID=1213861 RepID=A0A4R2JZG1_9PSEU|nr:ricin-type beta-trefoil lectin protein [Actinocrispum wychmicini]